MKNLFSDMLANLMANPIRTSVLYATVYMTWSAFEWAGRYAFSGIETNGMEAAAIIAAVTAPVTYLQAAVFKAYLESKA